MLNYAWHRIYKNYQDLNKDIGEKINRPGWYNLPSNERSEGDTLLVLPVDEENEKLKVWVFNEPNGKEQVLEAFKDMFLAKDYGTTRPRSK